MVEISLDHGHCLHHDASTTHDFGKLCRLITKIEILIEKWRSLFSPYFWNLPPRKNPAKFEPNYYLQVFLGSQLLLCFIILILYHCILNHCILYHWIIVSFIRVLKYPRRYFHYAEYTLLLTFFVCQELVPILGKFLNICSVDNIRCYPHYLSRVILNLSF